jgi:uncharacterized protein
MVKRDFTKLAWLTLEYGEQYGLDHSLRLIALVRQLAAGRVYNEDVIAFSAYVHDFGGYSRFAQPGKDHASRSMEILSEFLSMFDFSEVENAMIRETVAKHHSKEDPDSLEAILFRDADAIDFLGYIGIARNLMRFGKDMPKALDAIRRHYATLPGLLHEEAAKEMAKIRIAEMDAFFSGLERGHAVLLS